MFLSIAESLEERDDDRFANAVFLEARTLPQRSKINVAIIGSGRYPRSGFLVHAESSASRPGLHAKAFKGSKGRRCSSQKRTDP
jgi:hypothetical protein